MSHSRCRLLGLVTGMMVCKSFIGSFICLHFLYLLWNSWCPRTSWPSMVYGPPNNSFRHCQSRPTHIWAELNTGLCKVHSSSRSAWSWVRTATCSLPGSHRTWCHLGTSVEVGGSQVLRKGLSTEVVKTGKRQLCVLRQYCLFYSKCRNKLCN